MREISQIEGGLIANSRLSISQVAREDLTRFAQADSTSILARLPTERDQLIARSLIIGSERFRGRSGKMKQASTGVFFMAKESALY